MTACERWLQSRPEITKHTRRHSWPWTILERFRKVWDSHFCDQYNKHAPEKFLVRYRAHGRTCQVSANDIRYSTNEISTTRHPNNLQKSPCDGVSTVSLLQN